MDVKVIPILLTRAFSNCLQCDLHAADNTNTTDPTLHGSLSAYLSFQSFLSCRVEVKLDFSEVRKLLERRKIDICQNYLKPVKGRVGVCNKIVDLMHRIRFNVFYYSREVSQ